MEYAMIVACVIVAFVVGGVLALQLNNKKDSSSQSSNSEMLKNHNSLKVAPVNSEKQLVNISMEMIPADSIGDENSLKEITDSKLLGRINELIPGLAQVANNSNNAIQAAQNNGEVLYRAILPAGWKLAPSKAMEGAYRGFSRGAGGQIQGHANLVQVELHQEKLIAANTVSAVMGVAAMVVGQYYMTQVNEQLCMIGNSISKIASFQDNEYRSKVFSLIESVKEISSFQTEILENNELRLSKIGQLDRLKDECKQLLGQANLTLVDFTKKNFFEYDEYERTLNEVQNWFMYQKSLLDVLYKICDLKYTFYFGTVSREQCDASLPTYSGQVSETQSRLTSWHQGITKQLGIEPDKMRRKRQGLDGALHWWLGWGWLDDDENYRPIEEKTAQMMTEQISGYEARYQLAEPDLYAKDVQLIIKGGKVFYLPTVGTE